MTTDSTAIIFPNGGCNSGWRASLGHWQLNSTECQSNADSVCWSRILSDKQSAIPQSVLTCLKIAPAQLVVVMTLEQSIVGLSSRIATTLRPGGYDRGSVRFFEDSVRPGDCDAIF